MIVRPQILDHYKSPVGASLLAMGLYSHSFC